jgi:hypothetical protein
MGFLCGVYPKKQDNQEFPVTLMMKDGKVIKRDHLYKADLVPTGFMRIKRHVLEKMAARSMPSPINSPWATGDKISAAYKVPANSGMSSV